MDSPVPDQPPHAGALSHRARLNALCDAYWQLLVDERPAIALLAGIEAGDVIMREGPEDHERRAARAADLLRATEALGREDEVLRRHADWQLLHHELLSIHEGFACGAHLRPSLYPLGPEMLLSTFCGMMTLRSPEDVDAWERRLASIPASLSDLCRSLELGIETGRRPHRTVVARAVEQVGGLLSQPPRLSRFAEPALRAGGRSAAMARKLPGIVDVIERQVYPALARYRDFLADRLGPSARSGASCREDADGVAYYAALIRQHANSEDPPEALHARGLEELEAIKAQMEQVAAAAGRRDGAGRFRAALQADESQYLASAEALRERVQVIAKQIDERLPGFFGTLPRMSFGVRSIPDALSDRMPPAYAQPSSPDRSVAGVFWVTSQPRKCPRYLHVPLVLHEAYPGHLLHFARIHEQSDLPLFRRHGAFGYNACLEGWALYCESLGMEMGLCDEPATQMGVLEMALLRAARLVLDTGLHATGWSRQGALEFATRELALPQALIEAEIDRYIGMPAQALAYQWGFSTIRGLRRTAEKTLGSRFDARRFHDRLLDCGAVTLTVLQDHITRWIQVEGDASVR